MTTTATLPASRTTAQRPRIVALAGNPNVGKTTVFNQLTGHRQKVGNYPGVTVERKHGRLDHDGPQAVEIIDVPGTYSLRAQSVDEEIARGALLGTLPGESDPDLVVCVVDASNLERNLFLVSQILEIGKPVIVALNMTDAALNAGTRVSAPRLSAALGVPVVPLVASRGVGITALKQALLGPLAILATPSDRVAPVGGEEVETEIAARYAWIARVSSEVCERLPAGTRPTLSDRLDAVLTHRVLGPVCFVITLGFIFQAVFSWAVPLMDLIDLGTGALGGALSRILPAGPIRDLVVDGAVAGVGAVVVFLPQILILFLFLGLLEDSGYMARAAFIMDRLLGRVGLSGRSVVPLLSSFACAIPGIMATRTIDNQRDRLVTIMVAPLMTCSARLPVYTLLIGAFIPTGRWFGWSYQGLTLFLLYVLGVVFAVGAALVIKRFVVRGSDGLFMMELPPYRRPRLRDVLWRLVERTRLFLTRAGTIIFALTIVLWFLASFPRVASDPALASQERAARALEQSALGRMGRAIEPAIEPLGFDWKIGIALISSFAAREVAVSALATIYSVGDADETSVGLRERLRTDRDPDTGRLVFTPLVAVSLMVFYMLALQCMSTLAVARRETGGWRWPMVMLTYMTGLAYVSSWLVFQGGRALGLQG